jgi:hypothetical protein
MVYLAVQKLYINFLLAKQAIIDRIFLLKFIVDLQKNGNASAIVADVCRHQCISRTRMECRL